MWPTDCFYDPLMVRSITTIALLLLAFASPNLHADDVELTGIISDIGAEEWIVDGRVIVVTPDTELDTDDGPLVVGACAEVEGEELADGRIEAEEISSQEASECAGRGDDDDPDDDETVELKGVVDSAPDGGGAGDWRIGGRSIVADGDTEFDTSDGPLEAGACAEVEGVRQPDGAILAREIDSEDPSECGLPSGDDDVGEWEITGLIESVPNGLIGSWMVAGNTIEVTESTELETDDGPFVAGACVEAEGVRTSSGVLIAREIETKSDDDCAPGGDDEDDEVEFFGELERLPADGLIGDWTVDGTVVRVVAETEIDLNRGPVALGSCLKVEGMLLAGGVVQASEIEVRSGAGGCSTRGDDDDDDAIEFDGVVQEAPGDGDIGLWLISGRSVLVDETTEVDLQGGGPRVGLCVEVEGAFLDDRVFLASSLEADDNGRNCGAGPGDPVEVEVKGRIEELPPGNSLNGQWTVNGVRVTVSGSTDLDEDEGPFAVGACVEATGRFLPSGMLQAREVETEDDDDCDGATTVAGEVEFRGIATDAPEDGLEGVWIVGFQEVEVTAATELDDDAGELRVGACVKVEGARQDDGAILAREIEVENASGLCVASNGIVNAASFDDGAVSPGEILSIFGLRLGPPAGAGLVVDDNRVRSRVKGVRVWFDSTPAPILFARDDQVNVVAPFSIAGKSSVQIQIEWRGSWSRPIRLPVAAAGPGLLTLSQSGSGQVAALNVGDDGAVTVNGDDEPASPGQAVTLFAVGMGRFTGSFADGLVVGDDLPEPELDVRVTIDGIEAQVTYAGGAPGLVLGVLQVNVIVPEGVTLGDDVEVTLHVGDFTSQPGTTMTIQ